MTARSPFVPSAALSDPIKLLDGLDHSYSPERLPAHLSEQLTVQNGPKAFTQFLDVSADSISKDNALNNINLPLHHFIITLESFVLIQITVTVIDDAVEDKVEAKVRKSRPQMTSPFRPQSKDWHKRTARDHHFPISHNTFSRSRHDHYQKYEN